MRRLALALALLAWAAPAQAQDRPTVATVNYPLAYFAERLGGGEVDILFDAPVGRDPSFWRPAMAEIAEIQGADLIALNGAGFANWVTKVSLPRARLVDTSSGFSDAYIATETITHAHGADGAHSHTGTASYTWLDLDQAALQAEALARAMTRRLPDVGGIDGQLAALQADLSELDQAAQAAADSLGAGTILATHPRYQYFARAYGLEIDALDWDAGQAPTDAQWAALAQRLETTGARVLIWEAVPPQGALDHAAGMGLRNVVFPPLANRPVEGDFLSSLNASLSDLAGAGAN